MMARILVAEDDPLVASFLEKGLRSHGLSPFVVDHGEHAQELGLSGEFDLLLLEIGLAGRDGFHILQELRWRGSQMPIVVLTGQPQDRDVVACLQAGADDYMTKPFRFDELLARIRTRLRRAGTTDKHVLSLGAVRVDVLTRHATVDGRTVVLTAREFALLETLIRHHGQVLSREQLLSHIWGYGHDPVTNVVNVYVGALRKKLGREYIETVRGVGYRLRLVAAGNGFSARTATSAGSG